jgi:nitrite reductase/ring-hydroxylating ferredoxin subunit
MARLNSHSIDLEISGMNSATKKIDYEMPMSWYGIATSRSLKKGQIQVISFLGRDWILFRNQRNEAAVVSRYCSHMGADLSRGRVLGSDISCPLHQWRYDANGHCKANMPNTYKEQAKLESLATAEYAGVIFVFPAPMPLYPLPVFNDMTQPATSSTSILKLPFHFITPALNTFDISHYETIHNRQIQGKPEIYASAPYHLHIGFKARVMLKRWQDRFMSMLGFDTVDITVDYWGCTLAYMNNRKAGLGALIAVNPSDDGSTTAYLTAIDTSTKNPSSSRLTKFLKLEISLIMTFAFLKADLSVLAGMRPKAGVLIPGRDDVASQFWRHYQNLPKVAR